MSFYIKHKKRINFIIISIIFISVLILLNFPFINTNLKKWEFMLGMHLPIIKIIKGIIATIISFWVAQKIVIFCEKNIKLVKTIKASNRHLLINIFQIIIYIFAFSLILEVIGLKITTFTWTPTLITAAIAFASQRTIGNFVCGIAILFDPSIEIGDLVEIQGESNGYIKNIGAFFTIIECLDGRNLIVPNAILIEKHLTNWTRGDHKKRRVDTKFNIPYNVDINKVRNILFEIVNNHPKTSKERKTSFYILDFLDYAIYVRLSFWIDDITQGYKRTKSEVMEEILKQFMENNIDMPYPKHDVIMQKNLTGQNH